MRDPLVHDYVKGRIIGGWLGIALGITLIVLGSCLAACSPIVDSPQLRATYDTAVDVLPGPDKPRELGGYLRIRILPQETAEPSLLPTVTPKASAP